MDLAAEILHGALSIGEDDWLLIIGKLSLWLGVDPNQLQIIPHLLKKAVVVPFVMCRDRDTVGNLGDDFKLFNRDLVNLVQQVDAGYVVPVPLDNVDEIVNSGVAAKSDVSIGNSVFPEDLLDQIKVKLGLGHHDLQVDPPLVLLLEDNVGRRLVHPNAPPLPRISLIRSRSSSDWGT